jgi:hypothetical protein
MDEYRHKILVIFVFFMTNPKLKKENSIIHKKHKKLTRGEENEKKSRKYRVWFKVYFDPTLWISSK